MGGDIAFRALERHVGAPVILRWWNPTRMKEPQILIELSPAPADERTVLEGLQRHNDEYVPAHGDAPLAVFARGESGEVLGGLLGKTGRGWLQVSILWVNPAMRGRGLGTRLMAAAEEYAIECGCHSAYLNTFDFQAWPFYERCGYEVFGVLDNYPDEHERYFMRKVLKR